MNKQTSIHAWHFYPTYPQPGDLKILISWNYRKQEKKKKKPTNNKPEYSGENALSSTSKAPGILKYKTNMHKFSKYFGLL